MENCSSPASYIRLVHRLIEECILFNMSKEECMEALSKHANIKPVITSTGVGSSVEGIGEREQGVLRGLLEKQSREGFRDRDKEKDTRRGFGIFLLLLLPRSLGF
ncbi:uncharacterized protein LOC129322339 isoform X1 [Prosopis cineraria]|uniref:uncharacterized protein LOC129322339 isoform X1 n=1 Tax=Prosopis cineraria TaxID=364024 RepID=UPI0024107DCE|nr:uncharacterized protein LOC129322339 isoform X1 [Prosopis cineraria]